MTNSFRCKGVLFDCDGVLVDSDASVLRAWQRWAVDVGVETNRVIDIMHGRRSADTVAELIAEPDRGAALALIDRYEVDDAVNVTAILGAAELLATLPPQCWAVVTSG